MKQPLHRAAALLAVAWLWLATAASALAQSAPEAPLDLSLVTHNTVTIVAPRERIWPHVVEPGDWKAGARLVPLEGSGHRFKAVMPNDPATALYHVTNVELDAPARRTIRFNALDGSLIGFASCELTPAPGGTRVANHVCGQQEAPRFGPLFDREAYVQGNRKRFQQKLIRLKEIVDQAHRRFFRISTRNIAARRQVRITRTPKTKHSHAQRTSSINYSNSAMLLQLPARTLRSVLFAQQIRQQFDSKRFNPLIFTNLEPQNS